MQKNKYLKEGNRLHLRASGTPASPLASTSGNPIETTITVQDRNKATGNRALSTTRPDKEPDLPLHHTPFVGDEFYKILLAAAAPTYLADRRGNLIYANPPFYDFAAHAFIDSEDESRLTETPEALHALFRQIDEHGDILVQRQSIATNTSIRHYSARHFPLFDSQGQLVAYVGIYTDISDRIEADIKAKHTEARYEDVIRSASDWVWETDRNLNITFASIRIAEALGTPVEMLKGRYLFSLGHFAEESEGATGTGRQLPSTLHLMEKRIAFRNRLFVVAGAKGEQRHIHLSGVPVFDDESGRFTGYRGTGTDITRQHQAEAEAREARDRLEETLEELQQRNRDLDKALIKSQAAAKAKTEFLAMMSHELRTPLNAIIGFSDISMQQIFGRLNDKYLEYFGDISNAARHLLEIIESILELSRLEGDKTQLNTQKVAVALLLEEVSKLVSVNAVKHGIDISAVTGGGAWHIMAEPVRAREILVNLLENAIKFSPEGTCVGVDCKAAENGTLDITVWDQGPGMSEEDMEHIFESFYQASQNSQTAPNRGLGLGLTIAQYLARLMGGNIRVESTPGHGSRFTLRVPLALDRSPSGA